MQARIIALIGGTGFVGTTLAPKLTAAGWRVRILSRHPARYRHLKVDPQITFARCDVFDPPALRQALAGCDAAVNLIGILNSRHRDGREFISVHAQLPGLIAAACKQTQVGRLLHMSALRADAENGASQYLRSKGAGESAVRREAGSDVAVTVFQPSVIYGADDSFVNRFAGLLKLPAPFLPLPKANARFAPVHVADVADAFVASLDRKDARNKSFQLCGPQVFSLREIVQLIALAVGIHKPIVRMPDSLARLQAFVLEFVPGKPFSRDNLRSLQVNSICDANGFERLGIKPRSATTWIPRVANSSLRGREFDLFRKSAGR